MSSETMRMTETDAQEIVTGIWCWQRRPRQLRRGEFGARTSYLLAVDGETLLVDPRLTGGGVLRVWDSPLATERRRRWWHERYLPTLESLAALAAALRRALERDPWQCPKHVRA